MEKRREEAEKDDRIKENGGYVDTKRVAKDREKWREAVTGLGPKS